MRIAIEGCVSKITSHEERTLLTRRQGHGTLHAIYASIKKACEINKWKGIDLLIIGGDFQVRPSLQL